MAIAWSRLSSKVIADPRMPMRRAEEEMGRGKAVRAHVYRIWVTKESLKYGTHVTQR
jgi:hypothetical protein